MFLDSTFIAIIIFVLTFVCIIWKPKNRSMAPYSLKNKSGAVLIRHVNDLSVQPCFNVDLFFVVRLIHF